MPAEWDRHEATWLSWPKDPGTFPGEILPKVEETYAEMVRALSEGEEVRILVNDAKKEARARSKIGAVDKIKFVRIPTVDVWVRDYGPTYLKGKGLALVKWVFNAWGNKYDDLLPDQEAGRRMAAWTGLRVFEPGLVLEGGSIDVNGKGILLTTKQCLMNPNRNPKMSQGDINAALKANLGVKNVIWLGEGIAGDDTDGHVDDIARFVGPRKVLAAVESDESDPNHLPLLNNLRTLEGSTDQDMRALEVVSVPMPAKVEAADGRLPASHMNFYIGNSAVLVPTFGGDSDKEALATIQSVFPERKVVGLDCRALVYGLGTLHCVTQQAPAA